MSTNALISSFVSETKKTFLHYCSTYSLPSANMATTSHHDSSTNLANARSHVTVLLLGASLQT